MKPERVKYTGEMPTGGEAFFVVPASEAESLSYEEYKSAARDLADITGKMQAAQARFQAALQKLTAIVAPIPEVP